MRRLHLIIYKAGKYTGAALVPCIALLPLLTAHAQIPVGVMKGTGASGGSYSTVLVDDATVAATGEDPMSVDLFIGALRVRTAELSERGDSLLLKMELKVNEQAANKRQSWAIVPQLVAEDGGNLTQITFPYALVNGSIREKIYKRKLNFGNEELLANLPIVHTEVDRRTGGEDVVLHYTMQVPYQPWMDMADLKLHTVLVSPAGKWQLLSVENAGNVKFSPRALYEVQPKVKFIEPAPEKKQRKMQGQAYLDFQVGRSVIIPTFRRNIDELARIAQAVMRVRSNSDVVITGLYIEGYASPEGNYSMNDKLARSRSEALRDYMVKEFGLDRGLFRVTSMAEDWDGLRALVLESTLAGAQKQAAIDVMDSNDDPDRKEARLRAQSASWEQMSYEMFPQLRRSEYQIDFSVRDYAVEESRFLAERSPELLSQRELFLLAMSYPEGSEKWEEAFELSAHYFPDDAVSILNTAALMLTRGELAAAKRMLERTGDDARALNTQGVYYLLAGDLEKAKGYLEKAAAQGVGEATHNLSELKKREDENRRRKR